MIFLAPLAFISLKTIGTAAITGAVSASSAKLASDAYDEIRDK